VSRMHFLMELESIRQNLIQTGEMTMSFFDEALRAVWKASLFQPEKASELKVRIGCQCRLIHEQCLNLIVLQAPVARDARFVTRVLDTVVDLDLIGDYFYEIVVLAASKPRTAPSQTLREISEIGQRLVRYWLPLSTLGAMTSEARRFRQGPISLRLGPNVRLCMKSFPV
jgi:phosphate uptake regulator